MPGPADRDLAARIDALEDRDTIRDLIARYGPLADAGDGAGVAALWAADGVYAIAGMGEAVGHVAIAALIDGATHRALMADGCAHIMAPVTIGLDGDRAVATGYSIVMRRDGDGFVPFRVSANRWALHKGADGWRVARRDNELVGPGNGFAQLFAGVTGGGAYPPARPE